MPTRRLAALADQLPRQQPDPRNARGRWHPWRAVLNLICLAKLCGVAPIPASSGMTTRHRLAWNGHRQANAALYRTAIVRMQHHQPTKDYVAKRTAEGLSKRDIIRCLKRFIAREVYGRVMADFRARTALSAAA